MLSVFVSTCWLPSRGADFLVVQDTSKQLYMGDAIARLLLPALSVANTFLSAPGMCTYEGQGPLTDLLASG